jgi:hypothetical protein
MYSGARSSGVISGVSVGPGATQFTRMPCGAASTARLLVNAWIAPFAAA